MFDSNGPLPFFQEGMVLDLVTIDLCDLLDPAHEWGCRSSLVVAPIRQLGIPYGHGSSAGAETQCRGLARAKYCHNYFSPIFDTDWNGTLPQDRRSNLMSKRIFDPPRRFHQIEQKTDNVFNFKILEGVKMKVSKISDIVPDFKPETLVDLSEMLLEGNTYIQKQHSALVRVLQAHPRLQADNIVGELETLAASLMIFLWWEVNGILNGAGLWPYLPQLANQNMCYPAECTKVRGPQLPHTLIL